MQQSDRKISVQEQLANELRTRIAEGRLLPGASLSESGLAEEFGVSRTPAREALKRLQAEGIVEIRPKVGTFVTTPSRFEIIELFKVKEILEGAAAGMFAARAPQRELEQLRENVRHSATAIREGDVERYEELVHEFHDLIVLGAGNSKLEQHYRTLMNQLRYGRFVRTSLGSRGRAGESEHEHENVLAMIEARDEISAERLMRSHVHASQHAVIEALNAAARANELSA